MASLQNLALPLLLLPLALLPLTTQLACGDKGGDSGSTGDGGGTDGGVADGGTGDGGADGGADGGGTDGGGTDGGADGGGTSSLVSLEVAATDVDITTRDVTTVSVMGTYDDGSIADVTDLVTLSSSDTDVLRVYAEPEIQPIGGGTADVIASLDGVEDTLAISVTLSVVQAGDLVINEVLASGGVDGDPNGDGSTDELEDEFIELVNVGGASVDLSGVTISDQDFPGLPRHTFAAGTALRAGEAIVVFGGGDVSGLSVANASFVTAENDDPGNENMLALTDAGDRITVAASDGTALATLAWGTADLSGTVPAVSDASLNLSPDVTGTDYVDHSTLTKQAYSPGTRFNGAEFDGPDGVYGG